MKKLVIIGSNSIHCKRYIAGVLAFKRFDVSIITNQAMNEFVSIQQIVVNFALTNLKTVKQIRRELAIINPDIVHIHQANSYAWHSLRAIAKLKLRPKVILTTWGSDVLVLPERSRLMRKMVEYNLCNSDIITADSLFMSAKISHLLDVVSRPIYTLNFGIQHLPAKVDLVQNKQKIILSNRLHKPLYQINKIISAFAYLVNYQLIDDDYRLLVAASGEETPHLQELATTLGIASRVEFTGMLAYEQLVEYYRCAQVFVSVPQSDGTASSLLEAMAYGCIPVLSNLPANLEWVLDQINGFIAPNLNQLQQQILAAINLSTNIEAYRSLYDFNYQCIERKASAKVNMARFIELYDSE